jgi:transposase-like protein
VTVWKDLECREVADEDEAREIARTLNEDRRQLPREQRREVAVALRQEGHSQRAIAEALGVNRNTVRSDLQLGDTTQLPDRVIGLDGKNYPASQPKAQPKSQRGVRMTRAILSVPGVAEHAERLGTPQRAGDGRPGLSLAVDELAERLRHHRIRVSDDTLESFLLEWQRAGIAGEVKPGRWRLTPAALDRFGEFAGI